jgi:S-DNA-T family DNA segregation ATPase FtsK/SpoIIIE
MSTEPTGGEHNAEIVPLRAVPGEVAEPVSGGPPAYADVTAPGERKPILPLWLQSREALRNAAKVRSGQGWYLARFHGLRLPWYALAHLSCAVLGAVVLTVKWLRWWLFPVPAAVWADAIADGHRHWHRTKAVHKETTLTRVKISAAVLAAAWALGAVAWAWAPRWVLFLLAPAAVVVLSRFGRPEGVRIVKPAVVPQAYEVLTQDVIARALASLGIAGINAWIRDGHAIDFASPVRQDGPGWRAEINLPYGVTATQIIDRREGFASGLRRPLGAVWPEPVTDEHAGRLEVWVGQQDVSKAKAPAWPLAKAGAVDVFQPFPFAFDVRGRKVLAPLAYTNWLIGSIPRQGKTAAVRILVCGVALDPIAEQWIHELKGTGDLDPLEAVCHRFVSGIDDDSIAYAAESLRLLRAEIGKRSPRVKGLPLELCPERKVTREIAKRRSLRLWPIVCTIDEAQNLFTHAKYGKQAGEDAEFIIKVGPAMGIILILATQRPDAASLPKGISANVGTRFCLHVTGQVENDMILGTSAYKNGVRATAFRPETDAGLGYLKGATPAPKVCRTYFLDVPAAKAVVARARVARERAGTLSGVALGEDGGQAAREPLSDALACFAEGETRLWWSVLAERLGQRFPDRWAGITADAISAQLRPPGEPGVPSVTVSMGGEKAKGCRKADIEAIAGSAVTPRSER